MSRVACSGVDWGGWGRSKYILFLLSGSWPEVRVATRQVYTIYRETAGMLEAGQSDPLDFTFRFSSLAEHRH